MSAKTTRTISAAAMAALLGGSLLAGAAPALAQDDELPDPPFEFGEACPGFALDVTFNTPAPELRTFTDRDGNVVKLIAAGRGSVLTFTNLTSEPERSVTVDTKGSVSRIVPNDDGSVTVYATGVNGLILEAPNDVGSPSTVVYTGRLVYTVSPDNVFDVVSSSGKQRDICAELG
ncbi:hypothetical protein ACSNO4_03745 [Kocuria flava]|uniref:hypothetical protein n=1 Tax=Kocuria flava TaxID=446860 RepID=UPI003F1C7115